MPDVDAVRLRIQAGEIKSSDEADELRSQVAEIKNLLSASRLANSPNTLATIDALRTENDSLKAQLAAKDADFVSIKDALNDLKAQFNS